MDHRLDSDIFFGDEDFEDNFHVSQYIDDAQSHSLAYMASTLENKIINAKAPRLIVKCAKCVSAFIENELIEDTFIRFKAKTTHITQPCKSTFEICKFVDTFLKSCDERPGSYHSILLEILRKIPFLSLFASSNFGNHSDSKDTSHKYEFIKKIIELYMNMKSVHVAKCFTLKSHDEPIRHQLKKLIQGKGQ